MGDRRVVITGLVRRRSLYDRRGRRHRVLSMNELRELRRQADLSQRDFAGLLDVPVNTFRMWDSGMRPVPAAILRAYPESSVKETALAQRSFFAGD